MREAEEFDFAGDDRGVLCIHGFTGTPYEMRFLGESLAARGMSVRGIALPGHATRVEDLEPLGMTEWTDAVAAAFDAMAARCRSVAVVGQSMGGLLALHLATRRPVAAAASLAAPLWFEGLSGFVARVTTRGPLAGRVRYLPKLGGSDVRALDARRANPSYRAFPVRALGQLVAFMDLVDDALPDVRVPLLVLHGEHDHTAPVGSAARIAERVSARELRVRILPRSFHLIAIDEERTVVAAEVGHFFERHLRAELGG
ncbi:MAG: alpha/beta fold hydrolase [Deltaproteobacteria bacterium]|nr:alpha/beta fold hydrolase [Kofleriaceae bacterium]